jgi:surfactin synthase thioesterase subunit
MTSSATGEGRWIRRFHPSPDHAVRLVCFPHAGGAASYYFPFSRALAPEIEVLAVQYPGRQDRRHEPAATGIGALADRIVPELAAWDGRPLAFFGHSMGATVAYEVARRLAGRGGSAPVRLLVSGRRAPSRHRTGTVHRRDDAGLVAELRRAGSTDPRILGDAELLAAVLPVIRSDYRAIETYVPEPGPPLECPVTALVGDRDPQTTVDEADAWREHTRNAFELRVFAGGHFYLDACRPQVIDAIRGALGTAGAGTALMGDDRAL